MGSQIYIIIYNFGKFDTHLQILDLNKKYESISSTMLTCKASILSRQYTSKEYISNSIKSSEHQHLVFTGPNRSSKYFLINKNIISFFVKVLPKNNYIVYLNLNTCQISDQLLQILSRGNFLRLKELHLYNNELTGLSLQYIRKGNWKQLQVIDIGQNPIKYQINDRVFIKSFPQSVSVLHLERLNLNAKFLRGLQVNYWLNLTKIHLAHNNLMNEGLGSLVSCKWSFLQFIDLQNNQISNDGLKQLRKGRWPNIEYLYLQNNYIDDKGISYLASASWRKLKCLDISTKLFLQNSIKIDVQLQICTSIAKVLSRFQQRQLTVYLFYKVRYSQFPTKIQNMIEVKGFHFD